MADALPTQLDQDLGWWLTQGGDHRSVVSESGLTRYRTSNVPRAGVPFGSCTASWPSTSSFAAGEAVLESWRGTSQPLQTLEDAASQVHQRLQVLLGMGDGFSSVLAPSGTDALFMLNGLMQAHTSRRHIHHVVVGAAELGSGTVRASRCLTFSEDTPFAGKVPLDTPLGGFESRFTAEPFYLRGEDGLRLPLDDVDAEVSKRVRTAHAEGAAVVVHMVAHSKTGLRAPSAAAMKKLTDDLGSDVIILVDAAQGRVALRDIRHALSFGFVVLFTGSKFYSGPPFSGVLLVPASLQEDPGPLPSGLHPWFAKADLPAEWTKARKSLAEPVNPGLLLRWFMALHEIEAYHNIPEFQRSAHYHTFAGAVMECFGPSPMLRIDWPRPPVHMLASGLGSFPSVFGFYIDGPNGPLNTERAKELHTLLDMDLSAEDPRLGTRFHLGQPVALGPPQSDRPCLLRVALGARLVNELSDQPDFGAAWFRGRLTDLRNKIELLVETGRVG